MCGCDALLDLLGLCRRSLQRGPTKLDPWSSSTTWSAKLPLCVGSSSSAKLPLPRCSSGSRSSCPSSSPRDPTSYGVRTRPVWYSVHQARQARLGCVRRIARQLAKMPDPSLLSKARGVRRGMVCWRSASCPHASGNPARMHHTRAPHQKCVTFPLTLRSLPPHSTSKSDIASRATSTTAAEDAKDTTIQSSAPIPCHTHSCTATHTSTAQTTVARKRLVVHMTATNAR